MDSQTAGRALALLAQGKPTTCQRIGCGKTFPRRGARSRYCSSRCKYLSRRQRDAQREEKK